MLRNIARTGLAIAVVTASMSAADAGPPRAANPAIFGHWASASIAGSVPSELATTSGMFRTHPHSDMLTSPQLRAVRELVPLGYVNTVASRNGAILTTASFYGTRAGLLVVVRAAVLDSATEVPAALPIASVVTGGYVRAAGGGWASLAEVWAADGTVVASDETPTTASAVRADECSCGTALVAVGLWTGACVATGSFLGPFAPLWTIGCTAAGAGLAYGAEGYCETCKGSKGVELNPGWAEGWQTTDHPDTHWTVCYSDQQLDGYRIGLDFDATRNFLTKPGAASNRCRVFTASFTCCTSEDRVWDVRAWVEFPYGEWGYATGKVTVYHYGA